MKEIRFQGLENLGIIEEGDDLPGKILEACRREKVEVEDGDVFVITSKVVSMYEGRVVELEEVEPSTRARAIARTTGMMPEMVQLILEESRVVAEIPVSRIGMDFVLGQAEDREEARKALEKIPSMLVTVVDGRICTSAGVDISNSPEGMATLLPEDPDRSAKELREKLEKETGRELAVIIADSELTFRGGSTDIAIGCSGIQHAETKFGGKDLFGNPKFGGLDMTGDEIAGGAALLFGQTSENIPVVVAKGLEYRRGEGTLENSELVGKGLRKGILSGMKMKVLRLLPGD